jgi:hypothetical protein
MEIIEGVDWIHQVQNGDHRLFLMQNLRVS